jgi:nucleotide-binding universal stress UspA family protein
MYKRILVAIDGSVTSDLALREAIGLAKDQDAVLRLVHVVDVTPPAYMTAETGSAVALHFPLAEYQKALQEAGEKSLTTRAAIVRDAGVNVDTKLITVGMLGERIYEVIEEQSKQWPADLIVVGNGGAARVSASHDWQCGRRFGPDFNQTSPTHSRYTIRRRRRLSILINLPSS